MRRCFSGAFLGSIIAGQVLAAEPQIFACQYLDAAGFVWREQQWEQTRFKVDAPFFLKTVGGRLDQQSISGLLIGSDMSCVISKFPPFIETCSTPGVSVTFGHESMLGSVSYMFGAAQYDADESKDTLSLSIFRCQRM